MNKKKTQLGNTPMEFDDSPVEGGFVEIEGEKFYRIRHYDRMPDFFMTLVSDSDHWMYLSSNGSLSAGRKNRDNALFPYYTDDKIHDYHDLTGSKTTVRVEKEGKNFLWQPFSKEMTGVYRIQRNLYKSVYGNKILFEENNLDLGIGFQYGWYNSDRYGFVKKSRLKNLDKQALSAEVLDGIRNILPGGVDYAFQNEYSNLLDGYKKAELIEKSGLGLFMLSSIPVDRAEPSESLNATTVWSLGLENGRILISDVQLEDFKRGYPVETETDVRARRGAYYVNARISLDSQQEQDWMMVCEINQSTADVANLDHHLRTESGLKRLVNDDILKGTERLISTVAAADGLQASREDLSAARHYSNTLFNIMRGGIYINNYTIDVDDFEVFVHQTNKNVAETMGATLNTLPAEITLAELRALAEKSNSIDFLRISYEYLPLTFSRRHGDPSRPWNLFSIDTKNEDGSLKSDFQGNWRDIFQNWEALSLSYPEFIENIIAKFVNASTPDGYNPYRIMRSGIDWECPDPGDPWAYTGYWGDHQIIYLQKLLELSWDYHPGVLEDLLMKEIFAFANVPYRIKPYQEILRDPQDTIGFDWDLNNTIDERVADMGADGRLLPAKDGSVLHVNLTEKILITLLAKLSNFIPEAGIWLNTQRPEWNDANNALVGNGVSMVTLYYLRRFLKFWNDLFAGSDIRSVTVSEEVGELFRSIFELFTEKADLLETGFSDRERRSFSDTLGEAGTKYRESVYRNSFSGKKRELRNEELVQFTRLALEYIEHSIDKNKREDGLYHSYNLVSFSDDGISIRYLYKMLEGQVAVLSAGYLPAEGCLGVLDSLKNSDLFRKDQYSYLLYPDRQLPRFTEKNNIPAGRLQESKLLRQLTEDRETSVVNMDDSGRYHFHGSFRNAAVLESALDALDKDRYGTLAKEERSMILEIYEEIFDHQSFTGRSGTFYAYEGLGSIYWHMVSKLLLAAQECFFQSLSESSDTSISGKLKEHYYEIKAGIGLYKSPDLYGAFPTDAYSHTPGNAGARQPGMTGQVKEDFISRMRELGVRIEEGRIRFDPALLNPAEFLDHDDLFTCYALDKAKKKIPVTSGQLAFTLCQVPVIYTLSGRNEIHVRFRGDKEQKLDGNALDASLSYLVFNRMPEIERLEVSIKRTDR